MTTTWTPSVPDVSRLLRDWRVARRWSQLELALRAGVSQRHLSFIETGRSRPGADVVERLGEALDLTLRDRNRFLVAAGLAARHPEVPLTDAAVAPFRSAIGKLLAIHEPYPAFVLDRWWDVVDANGPARRLFPSAADGTVVNAVEAFFAPGGLREVVVNFPDVAAMYLRRLEAEVAETPDERLRALLTTARALTADLPPADPVSGQDLVICPRLRLDGEIVATLTMVARFGATREVTLGELRVELVFPADDAAEAFFRRTSAAAS